MTRFPRTAWAALALAAAVDVLCLLRLAAPQSALCAGLLTAHALVAAAALVKLALLLGTAGVAVAVRDRFGPGHPSRAAWGLLAAGFACFFAGQLTYAPTQLTEGTQPFPAPADLFFIPGTVCFCVALWCFVRAFRAAALVEPPALAGPVLVAAAGAVAIAAVTLPRVIAVDARPLERALNVAYPVLDLLAAVPLAVLFWQGRGLRGSVGRVWGIWLMAFAAMTLGDLLFAYFGTYDLGWEPLVHLSYVSAYALAFVGARLQLALLSPEEVGEAAGERAAAAGQGS